MSAETPDTWWVGALERYRDNGAHPGGWLQAVLERDAALAEGVASADNRGDARRREVMRWVRENLPSEIYGSAAKFREHRRNTAGEMCE